MSRDAKNQSETRLRVNVQKTWRRSGEHSYLCSQTLLVFKPNIANVLLLFQPSYDYWSGIVHISSTKPWPTRETSACDIYQMREKIRAELSNFPRRKWKQRREWSDSNSLRLITLHTAVAKVSKVKLTPETPDRVTTHRKAAVYPYRSNLLVLTVSWCITVRLNDIYVRYVHGTPVCFKE